MVKTIGELMRIASLIVVGALVSGCSATFKQNVLQEPSTKLMRGKSVVIATPADGWYGKTEYSDSGRMTAFATRAAFARFTNKSVVSVGCKDLPCLKSHTAGP